MWNGSGGCCAVRERRRSQRSVVLLGTGEVLTTRWSFVELHTVREPASLQAPSPAGRASGPPRHRGDPNAGPPWLPAMPHEKATVILLWLETSPKSAPEASTGRGPFSDAEIQPPIARCLTTSADSPGIEGP